MKVRPLQFLPLAWLALPALAAEVPGVASAGNLGRMLLGLGVVVALVFALAWAAKRVSGLRGLGAAGSGPIQVISQLPLGTRERLLLVEVDGRRLLLGVVPGSITRLDGDGAPAGEAFSARLDAARRGQG
ncbi:MAG: flagellar biosynthetic protein FliO [Pseudohaliea sp.]